MKNVVLVMLLALCPIASNTHAGEGYHVGDVVTYQNPNDGSPPRKARITRIDPDGNLWLDFAEFQPGLNIAEASKIVFKGTNAYSDWTRSVGAAPAPIPDAPPPDAPHATVPAPAPTTPRTAQPAARAMPAAATTLDYFFGKWSTLYVGHPVGYAPGDGYVYIQMDRAAKGGLLTLERDGSYTWSTSQGLIHGHWRAATADELRGQFDGPGIRLLGGENGWDYTVTRRPRQSDTVPDSIALVASGYQVNAYRVR